MVVIQNIINDKLADVDSLKDIAQRLMDDFGVGESELLVRLVSSIEIQVLNNEYRGKNQPTDVLSFPSEIPVEVDEAILGDVVICVDVVREEAIVGEKDFAEHLSHILIHGILHLLGYAHDELEAANKMESIEIEFLGKLGIKNPYS